MSQPKASTRKQRWWRRTRGDAEPPPPRRLWAQDVYIGASAIQAKLNSISKDTEHVLGPADRAVAEGVQAHLTAALNASTRSDPVPGRMSNWWRGTLVESAYQNLHAAEALIAKLYDSHAVEAEVPEAVARVEAGLDRDDPRRLAALQLLGGNPNDPGRGATLSKIIEIGFAATDADHTRLRNFRNAVVGSTALLAVFLAAFTWFVVKNPGDVPFCFTPDVARVCPSGSSTPSWHDIAAISLLGMLGGVLSAIVSIRGLQGTSIAYDVPQALALLRVPLGALSAIGGILIIRGEFIPGLTSLDTQDQILAYAFVFGFAQQLLVGLIDKQAQILLNDAPGKATAARRPDRFTTLTDAAGKPIQDNVRRSRPAEDVQGATQATPDPTTRHRGRLRRAWRALTAAPNTPL
jgi:hypothetical protein